MKEQLAADREVEPDILAPKVRQVAQLTQSNGRQIDHEV